MPVIELETIILSDIEICFDLSRSIELHTISTQKTNETVVDGLTAGLISINEFVTWEATHFGFRHRLSSKITKFERPFHFRDEQLKGPFKYIKHDHYFVEGSGHVVMKDIFRFQSPLGFIGQIVDSFVLTKYMRKLLIERNAIIKEFAETNKWKKVLNDR